MSASSSFHDEIHPTEISPTSRRRATSLSHLIKAQSAIFKRRPSRLKISDKYLIKSQRSGCQKGRVDYQGI
jgi:hypothetical protein